MKKLVAFIMVLLLACPCALADARADMIDYCVELINQLCSDSPIMDQCVYDADADVVMLTMLFERDYNTFKLMSDADMKNLIDLYMQADTIVSGSLDIAEVEAMTVSVAKTLDGVPFFLCINGTDQSWMLK